VFPGVVVFYAFLFFLVFLILPPPARRPPRRPPAWSRGCAPVRAWYETQRLPGPASTSKVSYSRILALCRVVVKSPTPRPSRCLTGSQQRKSDGENSRIVTPGIPSDWILLDLAHHPALARRCIVI